MDIINLGYIGNNFMKVKFIKFEYLKQKNETLESI